MFINTIINGAVLLSAGRIMKQGAKTFRLILSSFIGSLFALTVFAGSRSFLLILAVKLGSTVLITLIAFGYHSYKELLKMSTAVFSVSAGFGGMMLALYQLCRPPNMLIVNDVVYFEINPLILLAITALVYLIVRLIERLLRERIKSTVVRLSFNVDGQIYSCMGKIDTGSSLTEPFSGDPVIVADQRLFPIPDAGMIRVIPYTTVGSSSILYARKAEQVSINDTTIDKSIYIAAGDIHHDAYRAVINSEILR